MKTSNLDSFDLRIGNLLLYEDRVIEVVGLNKGWIEYYNEEFDKCGDKPKYFHPIELTEEILDKISQCTDTYKGDDYSRYIVFSSDDPYDEQECMEILVSELGATVIISRTIYPCIKYVHQLQNVYLVLTNNEYFTIHTFNNEIVKSGTSHRNAILAFPTEEMRDAFYENFKDLIENCKELL